MTDLTGAYASHKSSYTCNTVREGKIGLGIEESRGCPSKCVFLMTLPIAWSCLDHLPFFYLLCFLGRDTCTLSDTAMHKTMSLSIPALLTLPPDMLFCGILKLMSCCSAAALADVSLSRLSDTAVPLFLLFQTSECGDCCTQLSSPRGLPDRFRVM